LVVLAPASGAPVRVSGSAVDVWDMLESPQAEADLLAEVASRIGAVPDAVADDLGAALDVLIAAGAVGIAC
jgi:hypothetical protein